MTNGENKQKELEDLLKAIPLADVQAAAANFGEQMQEVIAKISALPPEKRKVLLPLRDQINEHLQALRNGFTVSK
jgi:LDH2 family malate/lactate/ureidoglycolate dehydrogenase